MKIFTNIRRSLFARLLLIFTLTAITISIYAALVGRFIIRDDRPSLVWQTHLQTYMDYLLADLGTPPDIEKAKQLVQTLPIDMAISGPQTNWRSSNQFPPLDKLDLEASTRPERQFGRYHRLHFVHIQENGYSILFATPKLNSKHRPSFGLVLLLAGLVAILLLCYFSVRHLFKPLHWLTHGVNEIGSGKLSYRIDNPRQDELADVTQAVNQMASDVEGMLESKRQLLLAISHELRTPLTRAKVAAEFIEEIKTRDGIGTDLNEMEQIIAKLIESERLNQPHNSLNLESIDPADLVRDLIDESFSKQRDRIQIEDSSNGLHIEADALRLQLLIKNLLQNALDYSGNEKVDLHIGQDSEQNLLLRISDHGSGIPEQDINKVFEPFYRTDASRQRATGGHGLGLYLCKLIVDAHKGKIQLKSLTGVGTSVIVTLPANAVV